MLAIVWFENSRLVSSTERKQSAETKVPEPPLDKLEAGASARIGAAFFTASSRACCLAAGSPRPVPSARCLPVRRLPRSHHPSCRSRLRGARRRQASRRSISWLKASSRSGWFWPQGGRLFKRALLKHTCPAGPTSVTAMRPFVSAGTRAGDGDQLVSA